MIDMMKLEKGYLMKITGIGENYSDKILDVYNTYDEILADTSEQIKDNTGLPIDRSHKVSRRIGRLKRLHRLEEEPDEIVGEKKSRLEEKIPQLDYHDTEEGNICMKEHLEDVLDELDNDPDGWIADEIAEIERRL